MLRDHLVQSIGEEAIADYAARLRSKLGVDAQVPLHIVEALERLVGKVFPKKGTLSLRIFQKQGEGRDAYVTFSPLTLHLEEEVRSFAKIGDPWSRFVVAHEIGHVLLHTADAKAFSGKDSGFGIFGVDEVSAEWQADTFAGHLLVPDSLAAQAHSAEELAQYCNVEVKRAKTRLESVKRRRLWQVTPKNYAGDACVGCRNFALVRHGIRLKCEVCGVEME